MHPVVREKKIAKKNLRGNYCSEIYFVNLKNQPRKIRAFYTIIHKYQWGSTDTKLCIYWITAYYNK